MTDQPIHFHRSVTSTNDLALAAVDAGAAHGACWAADRQSAGRGRREVGGQRRQWFSPANANLYLSVLLKPEIEPTRASGLTLAAARGICRTLRELTAVDLWVKWPNDLFVGDKKVGGILTEARTGEAGLEAVVVGVGINVNITTDEVPAELADIMTSLQIEAGRPFDRLRLLPAVRQAIIDDTARYAAQGYPGILEELRGYDRSIGRTVSIQRGGDWVEGVARGISDDGGLKVEIDGRVEVVQAGEVRFL
jgi:BirA family transcriptional regulator, biotin operon repressor / biotin---[acetyl-CoA-carboxylase] ligase